MKPHQTHSGRFARQDGRGHLVLTWAQLIDDVSLCATLSDGRRFTAQGPAFDLALENLARVLPEGTMAVMCATCALGFLDHFSGPDGYDDWSCFRDEPELARDLRQKGKQAAPKAHGHMHRVRVLATDVCPAYIKRV